MMARTAAEEKAQNFRMICSAILATILMNIQSWGFPIPEGDAVEDEEDWEGGGGPAEDDFVMAGEEEESLAAEVEEVEEEEGHVGLEEVEVVMEGEEVSEAVRVAEAWILPEGGREAEGAVEDDGEWISGLVPVPPTPELE